MARDNFLEATKRAGAMRVAYRCCFKGCGKITVGPADNSSHYQNNGVACHICAASKNGPRYDSSMSKEERISLDNLIWMCSNHSHQIDSDKSNYSVEELREWKKIMEEQTLREFTSVGYFEKKKPIEVEFLFQQMLENLDIDKMKLVFDQYNLSFGTEIDEIVLRYKVFFYCLTEYRDYSSCVEEYFRKKYEKKEQLISFALETCSINSLREIKKQLDCVNESNEEIDYICQNGILKYMGRYEKKMLNYSTSKLITTYTCIENYPSKIIDNKKNVIPYCSENSFFELLTNSIELNSMFYSNNDDRIVHIFEKVITGLNKIELLRIEFRIYIYRAVLCYMLVTKDNRFLNTFESLTNPIKSDKEIKKILFLFKIENGECKIDELVSFCDEINDYSCLIQFLDGLSREKKESFFSDRKYLLKKSSVLFYFAYENGIVNGADIQKDHPLDLYYSVICCLEKIDYENNLENLKLNRLSIPYILQSRFIEIMINSNNVGIILEHLDENYMNDKVRRELLIRLGTYSLDNSEIAKYCLERYNFYLNKGDEKEYEILCAKGDVLMSLNRPEEAKKAYIDAYLLNKNDRLLEHIIGIRINTNDYTKDSLFDDVLKLKSQYSQWFIAQVYKKNNNIALAKQYLLNCYCMKFQINAVVNEMFLINGTDAEKKPLYITDDTVAIVEKDGVISKILFIKNYDSNLIYSSTQNEEIACISFQKYQKWKYKKVSDAVIIDSRSYKIKDIIDIYDYVSRAGLENVINDKSTIVFRTSDEGDPLKEIKDYMGKMASEKEKAINEILSMPVWPPMSYISQYFRNDYRAMIESLSTKTLFHNNINYLISDYKELRFIASTEVVYFLYKLSKKYTIDTSKFCISNECFVYYNSLINDHLFSLDNPNEKGTIASVNGNIVFFEATLEYKSAEYEFWNDFRCFISKLEVLAKYDSVLFDFDKTNGLLDKFDLEKSVMTAHIYNKSLVICTEDSYLNMYSNINKISNIGISDLLPFIVEKEDFLEALNFLYQMKFSHCITKNVYSFLVKNNDLFNSLRDNKMEIFDEKTLEKITKEIEDLSSDL